MALVNVMIGMSAKGNCRLISTFSRSFKPANTKQLFEGQRSDTKDEGFDSDTKNYEENKLV